MKTFKNLLFFSFSIISLNVAAQLTVSSTNNVGIGIITPHSALDVNGNIQISNATLPMGLMTEVGGTTPLLNLSVNFRETNKNSAYIGAAFRIDTRISAGAPLFQWLYVPVGCLGTSCNMTLMQLSPGSTATTATLNVLGIVQANSVTLTSDQRLKTNIHDLDADTRSKLSQLHAVNYNFKPDSTVFKNQLSNKDFFNRSRTGFLAQDVQKIYPEFVYADKDGSLSLDYISLIPILIESFKDQQSVISELKTDVAELKIAIAELKKEANIK